MAQKEEFSMGLISNFKNSNITFIYLRILKSKKQKQCKNATNSECEKKIDKKIR